MERFVRVVKSRTLYIMMNFVVLLIVAVPTFAQAGSLRSSNGKYEATLKVRTHDDVHYQVKERSTGRKILTTRPQYRGTPNDVKAGMFSPDSQFFAAAYHYSHDGDYTWIGIWNVRTRSLIKSKKRSGWTKDISWVFEGLSSQAQPAMQRFYFKVTCPSAVTNFCTTYMIAAPDERSAKQETLRRVGTNCTALRISEQAFYQGCN